MLRTRQVPASLSLLAVVLAAALPARAQESRPARPYELAYAAGDMRGMLRLALDEVRALPPSFEDPVAEADAEILLLRVSAILPNDPAAALDALARAPSGGWIGARASFARRVALDDLGRFAEAEAEAHRIGFLHEFLIAGPFDNERGAGQQVALAPEAGPVDPEAAFDGKDRQVRWRTLGQQHVSDVVDLADLLVPKEQCLAYLATTIQSPVDQTIALGIGHSSFCRVWLDGDVVYEREVQRDDAVPDQEHVPVRLRAGPNELLVKIGVVTGPFKIALRLAAPGGGPPPEGISSSAAPEAFTRKRPAARGAESRRAGAASDARSSVEARAKAEDAGVDDLVRACRLRLLLRLDDRAHPETPALSARAVAKAPGELRALEANARALRRHTDIAAEKEDNARIQALRAVLAVAPDHVLTLAELGRTYHQELRHVETATGFLERALATNPSAPDVLGRLARVRDDLGQHGRAEALLRRAFAAGGVDQGVDLATFLLRDRRFREAGEVLDAVRKAAPGSVPVLRALGTLADESGDLEGAIAFVRMMVRRTPTDHEPRLRLAALLDAAEDRERALAELDLLLQLAPDLVEARRRAAILADRLGRRELALDHLAHALVIEPGNAKLRRLEGWLSGHEKSFEDEFPVDARELARKAPDFRVNPDNQPYRYLLRRTVVRVNADGTAGVYRHFVAQILNQRGVEDLDLVHASFDSREQRSRFKTARLFRGDAAPVEADRPYPGAADFPALQPGDVIEWSFRVDDLKQSFFGNYFGFKHRFQGGDLAAVDRSELVLLLPKSRSFQFHARNAKLEPETIPAPAFLPDHEGRRYVLENVEFVPGERAMPDPDEFVPALEVSTYRSWDEFASWWWNLIHKQYDVTDAMRAKVREIVAGATTREEKIRAIYDFVVSDIRYVAWEFGVHGYKPYRSSAIFDRRFGDCKDKALVMNTMLKEAGIEGYPVLIRLDEPRSAEDHTLPLVEHFNHCIVAIPEDDGTMRFLDGTAEFHAVSDLPDGDRGAKVVVVRDGKAVETAIPVASPDDNFEREEIKVALRDDGSASIAFRADLKGHHAVGVRSKFVNEADRKEELTDSVNRRFGQGTLGDVAFSALKDLAAPVWMSYAFEVGDLLNRDGDRARIRPLWSEFDWTSIAVTEKRRFDILVGSPSRTVTVADVTLPPKWKVAAAPEDTLVEEPFARYELKRTLSEGSVRFERTLVIKVTRVKAEDYQVFRRFVTKVAEADRETVTLEAVK
jgi:tetratricopeptide (TPR) repeat protein